MPRVLTAGHSTRTAAEFVELLRANGVRRLIDIRTVPRSARNPQFDRDTFPQALAEAGIGYTHLAGLGGLRKPRRDSPNTGWRNTSFRGYADYMLTAEFERALAELIAAAEREQVAIMCAEALPWRCHRSLVADALAVRGIEVAHIMGAGAPRAHSLTSFAHVEGTRVTYPS